MRSEMQAGQSEHDWSYLRANLDRPRGRLMRKLGSALAASVERWIEAFSGRRFGNNRQPARGRRAVRLELVARIALGQRQTVALIEADGSRLLVATSGDGMASFFPLAFSSRQAFASAEHGAEAGGEIAGEIQGEAGGKAKGRVSL